MKEFPSFLEAGIFLGTVVAAEVAHQHKALDRAAEIIQTEAKEMLGEYQAGAGELVPWAELADATKDDRARQGFPEDEPLLRTGEMRDGIQRKVLDGETAAVGSDDDKAVWQELGTSKIPPRSFLGIAAIRKGEEAARVVGDSVAATLAGKGVFGGSMKLR